MHLKGLIGVVIICLLFGCSIFKKNEKPAISKTTNLPVIDSTLMDTLSGIDSLIVALDTIAEPAPPKKPLEYMTIEEKAMIEEINLLRADPNAYIQYVDQYIQDYMADPNWDFDTKQTERNAGEELIRKLRSMPPLDLLEPSEELYKVAARHGMDMKENKMISHRGSDDSLPENRIQDSTSLVGSENLAAGGRSVRESVIMLLVDANDRMRSHRTTILNPSWTYVACYYAGTVDEIPSTWVQLFGFKDPNDVPREPSIRSVPPFPDEEQGAMDEARDLGIEENPVPDSKASGDFSFMTKEEKSMLDEINLMRTNPKGYIKYVESYAAEMKKMMLGGDADFDLATSELTRQLRTMPKLNPLKPHKKLYDVAKAHGLDNRKHNQLEHTGTDGRSSFKRVKDAGLKNSINDQGIFAPNENLAAGGNTIRETVIMLLIDTGISTRGHRKALIEPSWEYVACYKIGTIPNLKDYREAGMENADADNCWVQFFAKD